MNPTESLFSCHSELSNLANQLQNHRNLLINDPYIRHAVESSNIKPSNSFYFPYCSMVEKYIHFADEYHDKLNEFKGLLLDSVQICGTNNTTHTKANTSNCNAKLSQLTQLSDICNNNHSDDCTPTPSIIYDDTYLPIIDEDKETVYSYNSYNLSTIAPSTCDALSSTHTDTDNDNVLYLGDGNDNDQDSDTDTDDESQYVYSDESDEDDTPLFIKPIYCSTLIYISMGGQQQSYKQILKLCVDIGAISKEYIKNIVFKQNYNGFYYALVTIKESVNEMNRMMHDIEAYSSDNNLKIVINIFKPQTSFDYDYGSDYYLNMKQSNKLCVAHFDILDGNIYYDLIKLFGDFGEIKSIEIFENDNNENDPYALVEFKSIRDAVKCFDAHNINMNMSGYCKSLYLAHRLLQIKYAH